MAGGGGSGGGGCLMVVESVGGARLAPVSSDSRFIAFVTPSEAI